MQLEGEGDVSRIQASDSYPFFCLSLSMQTIGGPSYLALEPICSSPNIWGPSSTHHISKALSAAASLQQSTSPHWQGSEEAQIPYSPHCTGPCLPVLRTLLQFPEAVEHPTPTSFSSQQPGLQALFHLIPGMFIEHLLYAKLWIGGQEEGIHR